MATLTIKYYRDSFNSNRVHAIKKSKHGHYFINQYNNATKLYNAFKRVSVKVVKDLLAVSTPCNKPSDNKFVAKVSAILASHNMEANTNISTIYAKITKEAHYLRLAKGLVWAEDYLYDILDQGYDRDALQDCLDLIDGDILV